MSTPANAALFGDCLALLRGFLADDVEGAARVISRLEPGEVLLVLGGLVQVAAGLLTDIARATGATTDELLEQLLNDLQRRTT